MNYPDKIAAAKHIYRRCHHKAPNGEEALLRLIEDVMMAGMHRVGEMSHDEAVVDYLTRVVRHNYVTKKEVHKRRMKSDMKERAGFIQAERTKGC